MVDTIRIEEFNEISIRARFAYGVCCLENALVNYDKNIDHWKNLLAFMWRYPAVTGMLNEWPDKMVYFEPSTILKYSYEEGEEITRAEYDFYKELYLSTKEPILSIINLLGSIPREELYIGMPTWSPDTLNLLKQIIEIMCNNGIELPDIKPFKQYKFDYLSGNGIDYLYYGWGETFDGKQYSKFLKS